MRTEVEHVPILIDVLSEKPSKLIAYIALYGIAQVDIGFAILLMVILFLTDFDIDIFTKEFKNQNEEKMQIAF